MSSKKESRTNQEITNPEIRFINPDGENVGVIATVEALRIAEEAGLDLVEIQPNAEPPVCKVMDYGKFRFEHSKRQQQARKKQKQIQVKEVKFRPGTEEGDYQVKLRNIVRFLTDGDKAKITIRFRGREMAHQERGTMLLDRVEADVEEYATVEQRPKLEGRQMVMVLSPKNTK